MGPIMPEFLAIMAFAVYAAVFFVLWKFYQVLTNINESLVSLRQALERNAQRHPGDLPPQL